MPGHNARQDWQPPDLGQPLSDREAIRLIGAQLSQVTRMISHVAAALERHEHWHEADRDDEMQRLRDQLAAARAEPRSALLVRLQLWGTVFAAAGAIAALVVAFHP